MIKILVKQPESQLIVSHGPLKVKETTYNYGCNDTRNAYESCIKEVDIDLIYIKYRLYRIGLQTTYKSKPFSEYLLEQIGE